MDASCSDDQTTTSETAEPAAATNPCPVGSRASVVLDPEAGLLEAQSRKLPSSRFKGVVPQSNGRWGAQIYEKHQRVWLGTFNEEHEAARAYDIGVQRFRDRDAVTNFKLLEEEAGFEAGFLRSHSKAEIVDMLRKHTYDEEMEQSKRSSNRNKTGFENGPVTKNNGGSVGLEQLFEKTVTPSDVGKLNRLVIPKQHAEKHFPLRDRSSSKGMLLHFEDSEMKVWRFRYSYWNSSQSYVLTKGWSRFVKEKSLKPGDIVSFQRSNGPDKQLFIDWKRKNEPGVAHPRPVQPVQMLRLFGVNILSVTNNGVKRNNVEMELGLLNCKKQRVIDSFLFV